MLLATRLAATKYNFTLEVHESSGLTTPKLLASISSSLDDASSLAVLGLSWSNVALDVMRKVPFPPGTVALGSSGASSLDEHPHFFRTGYRDEDTASVLIDHVAQTLGWRTIALIGMPSNEFGLSGIIGVNRSVAASNGVVSVIHYESVQANDTDFDLQAAVRRMAAAQPDGFIISAPGPSTRSVLRAAAVTNNTAALHGEPRWLATEKVEFPTNDVEGRRGAESYVCYAPSPRGGGGLPSEMFRSEFVQAFDHEPNPWAFNSYSQVQMLAEAMKGENPMLNLEMALKSMDLWTASGRLKYLPDANTPMFWTVGMYQYRGKSGSNGVFFDIGEVLVGAVTPGV